MQKCRFHLPGSLRLDLGHSPGLKTTRMLTLLPGWLTFGDRLVIAPHIHLHMNSEVLHEVRPHGSKRTTLNPIHWNPGGRWWSEWLPWKPTSTPEPFRTDFSQSLRFGSFSQG